MSGTRTEGEAAPGVASTGSGEGAGTSQGAPAATSGKDGGQSESGTPSGGKEEGSGSGAPGSPPPAKPQDWKEKRIARLSGERSELQSRIEAQAAEIAELKRLKGEGTGEAPPPPGLTQADVDRRAEQIATEKVAQQRFNDQCLQVAADGREKFKDFDAKVGEVARLVDPKSRDSVQAYTNLVAAAIKTGSAPEILHQLGGDLDEAARILELPPVDQALALGKLIGKGGERTSQAPEPIDRVRSRGASGSTRF